MIDFICICIGILIIFLNSKYINYSAKKCGFNCKKCKVFDCPGRYCFKQLNKEVDLIDKRN